jgi:hypothetical protein
VTTPIQSKPTSTPAAPTPPAGHPQPKPQAKKPDDAFEPGKSQSAAADHDAAKLNGSKASPQAVTQTALQDARSHNDPKYAGELATKLAENGNLNTTIAHLPQPTTKVIPAGKGAVETRDDHGVPQFLDGVAQAEKSGRLDPQALLTEAARQPNNYGWQQVAQKTVDTGSKAISGARSDYDTALAARETADKRLNQELATVGPGLNDKQRKEFVQDFHDKNKDVYNHERQAASTLDQTLKTWAPALEEAAKTGVPKGAADKLGDVVKGYESLAKSPQAEDALRWVGRVSTDSHLATEYAKGDSHLADHLEQTVTDGLDHGTAAALARHQGDAKGALAEIKGLVGPIKTAAALGQGVFGLKNLGHDLTHFQQGIEDGYKTFDALSRGDTTALQQLKEGWDGKSKLQKSLAVSGLVFGVATAGNDVRQGKFGDALVSLAGSSPQIAQVAARALGTYAEAGKLAAQAAGKSAEFLARFAPGVGVLASGVSLYLDAKAASHGDPGAAISVVGDSLSAVGSAIEVIPGVGTFAGGVINGIGSAISFGGMLLDTVLGLKHDGPSPSGEAQGILEKMGLPKQAAAALVNADPKMLEGLRGAVKGAADPAHELQQILARYPEFAHRDTPGPARQIAQQSLDLAKRLGVKPGQTSEFLDRLSQAGTKLPGYQGSPWASLAMEMDHVNEELRGIGQKIPATGAKFDRIFNPQARALLEKEFPWLKALVA